MVNDELGKDASLMNSFRIIDHTGTVSNLELRRSVKDPETIVVLVDDDAVETMALNEVTATFLVKAIQYFYGQGESNV